MSFSVTCTFVAVDASLAFGVHLSLAFGVYFSLASVVYPLLAFGVHGVVGSLTNS